MSVYLDHNATTPLREEVRRLMDSLREEGLGNPSSLHGSGRRARQMIDAAREQAAAALGLPEDSLTFTSGGTEANNLALLGAMRARANPGTVVTTAIEHSSVLAPAQALVREGHRCQLIPVDRKGQPDIDALCKAAAGARLVSVMAGNNEIGVCPPLVDLVERLPRGEAGQRVLFHSDAAQAVGRIEVPWELLDLASLSAHKFGGPLGVGLLIRRGGVQIEPICHGGGQELGFRPGTEHAVAIAGAALALELACEQRETFARRAHQLGRSLWERLRLRVPGIQLLGPELREESLQPDRLPGTLNILAQAVDGKVLVTRLDLAGLEISAGSACASGSLEASHVLLALGFDETRARAGLRVSIGRTTRAEDVDIAVEILGRTLGEAGAR
ncbi:MAG TPA: cysteine desulfurase family protein [Planctomycetota bacterium]|nr:cysteine desulfurase family protein [Planctomycetota bacterium]